MKIAAIGDIHGKKIWKDIANDALKKCDVVVFLGDYIDPYPTIVKNGAIKKYNIPSFIDTKSVLEGIINFKKEHKNRVILLIGNHDAHYMYDYIKQCSRYDVKNAKIFKEIYRSNIDLFQYAYQYKNKLFVHAGVTNSWINLYKDVLLKYGLNNNFSNVGEVINNMSSDFDSIKILNNPSKIRGGNSLYGSPIWADITETDKDYLINYDQYVGHNIVPYIYKEKIFKIPGSITYCDMLEYSKLNIEHNYCVIDA